MKNFKELTQKQMQVIRGGEDEPKKEENPNIDPDKVGTPPPKPKFKAGSDLADAVQ